MIPGICDKDHCVNASPFVFLKKLWSAVVVIADHHAHAPLRRQHDLPVITALEFESIARSDRWILLAIPIKPAIAYHRSDVVIVFSILFEEPADDSGSPALEQALNGCKRRAIGNSLRRDRSMQTAGIKAGGEQLRH